MIELIKLGLAYICLLATCFFGFLWTLLRPFNPEVLRPVGRVFGTLGKFFLGIKIEIEGKEIFKQNRPAIIISNHQDNVDIFVVGSIFPSRTVSVGKQVLKWIPFFGQFYWLFLLIQNWEDWLNNESHFYKQSACVFNKILIFIFLTLYFHFWFLRKSYIFHIFISLLLIIDYMQ